MPFRSNHGKGETRLLSSRWECLLEGILVIFTFVYHIFPMFFRDKMFLITHPIYSTLVFIASFGFVEALTFCYLWKWCKGDQKSESEDNQRKARDKYEDMPKQIAIFAGCFCISHLVCVLFGAALTVYVEETATWALLATALIAIPNLCVLGVDLEPWYRVIICGKHSNQVEQLLYFQCVGVAVGSWASAVVIPLDWDRDWQMWPIPCIIGCLSGYCVAVIYHCVLIFRTNKGSKVF